MKTMKDNDIKEISLKWMFSSTIQQELVKDNYNKQDDKIHFFIHVFDDSNV